MNSPRRFLFVSHASEWSGSAKMFYLTLKGLDRSRFHPFAVLPEEGALSKKVQELGIEFRIVPTRLFIKNEDPYFLEKITQNTRRIVEIIRERNIQGVVSNTGLVVEGALAAAEAGIAHVWHIHELFKGTSRLRPYLRTDDFFRTLDFLSQKIIACAPCVKKELHESGIPAWKIRTILNGIEEAEAAGCLEKQALFNTKPGTPVVCFLGVISSWKGALLLPEVAAAVARQIPEVLFVVAGQQGDIRQELEERIRSHDAGRYLRFLGFRDDPLEILKNSDLLLLLSESETTSLVLLEAMSVSKPVVATRCGGGEEIVEEEVTGALVPAGDALQAAEAIVRLLKNPEKRQRMGTEGRKKFERMYSFEIYRAQMNRALEECVPVPAAREDALKVWQLMRLAAIRQKAKNALRKVRDRLMLALQNSGAVHD